MLVYKDGITIDICERDLVQYKNAGYVEVKAQEQEQEAKPKAKKK